MIPAQINKMSQLLKDESNHADVDQVLSKFEPRTELGRRLASSRAAIIESGIPLLDDEELAREIAERRGGVYELESSDR